MTSVLLHAVYVVWSALVGASVSVQVAASVKLVNRAPIMHKDYYSVFVGTLSVALGGLLLLPWSLLKKSPWHKPSRWWALLGGLLSLPSYITIAGGKLFGIQLVILAQLIGLLGAGILLDLLSSGCHKRDFPRYMGLLIVVGGIVLNNSLPAPGDSGNQSAILSMNGLIYLGGSFVSGVAFGLMPKCTNILAQDFGSSSRSTMVSALVCTLASAPAILWIVFHQHVDCRPHADDWLWWAIVGGQSAVYIGSLSKLPNFLSYTTIFCSILAGELFSSALIDALDFTGTKVTFTWIKGVALVVIVIGATMASRTSSSDSVRTVISDADPACSACLSEPGTA